LIETNLLAQKKSFQSATVMGIDLAKINVKMLVLALIILYVPESFLADYFTEQKAEVQAQIDSLTLEIKKISDELEGTDNLRGKLDAFNRKVQELQKKSEQVDKIVKERTNPSKLLDQIAKNTPEDLWLNELKISENKEILILGSSETYKSIGDFMALSNDSPFFGRSLTLSDSKTTTENNGGKEYRKEDFEIKGTISVFDPWMQ